MSHGDAAGTRAGYSRHLRSRERACDACMAANTERSKTVRRPRVAPPLDVIAILRAVAGDRVQLTYREREEAVRALRRAGLRDPQIAERLGVTRRTVLRIRHRLDLPPVAWQAAS